MANATSGQAYLDRFMAYTQWSQNLPQEPGADFLAFIDSDTPLATKLREKWLYQLAHQQDWANFCNYYRQSADVNLQCLAQIANFKQGRTEEALKAARLLWLSGNSQPPTCNALFDLMIKAENFDEHLITQRIILALDKRNLGLARFLLKQYKQPRLNDEQLLTAIYQNPTRITQLKPGELHDYFYLFGLKRLISTNMDKAIKYWQSSQTRQFLNEAQQQAFLIQLVIYKAMRSHDDEPLWFAKIKPIFYNEILLDWQIRFALKRQQWDQVEYLVEHSPNKDEPCWQYWLARALEARGAITKAQANIPIRRQKQTLLWLFSQHALAHNP